MERIVLLRHPPHPSRGGAIPHLPPDPNPAKSPAKNEITGLESNRIHCRHGDYFRRANCRPGQLPPIETIGPAPIRCCKGLVCRRGALLGTFFQSWPHQMTQTLLIFCIPRHPYDTDRRHSKKVRDPNHSCSLICPSPPRATPSYSNPRLGARHGAARLPTPRHSGRRISEQQGLGATTHLLPDPNPPRRPLKIQSTGLESSRC